MKQRLIYFRTHFKKILLFLLYVLRILQIFSLELIGNPGDELIMKDIPRDENNETSTSNITTNNHLPLPSCDKNLIKCTWMREQKWLVINWFFWNLKKCFEKTYFNNSHVIRSQVARRTGAHDSKRMNVVHYHLPKKNGVVVPVCRSFIFILSEVWAVV